MYVKEVTVENQVGLHARPATFFIQKANEFKSSIWVEKEERRVNAKSLLGVLSLGIVGGTTIRIIADGADEQAAVDGLIKLVESGFCRVIRAFGFLRRRDVFLPLFVLPRSCHDQSRTVSESLYAAAFLPGVYIIRDKSDTIISIGKAKRLRIRVSQYFLRGCAPRQQGQPDDRPRLCV